jgi:hypothetical protein
VREVGDAEGDREERLRRLRAEEDPALVRAVGDRAGVGAQDEDRQRLQGDRDP